MKIDANDKYDVIDIVSNISSQVTDNKENIIKDSPFSVILENTLKYDDVQSLQEKVATSGKSLPLSLTTDDRESVTYNQNILSALAESSGENISAFSINPLSMALLTILDRRDFSNVPQLTLGENDKIKMRADLIGEDNVLNSGDNIASNYQKPDWRQALSDIENKEFNIDNSEKTPKIIIKSLNDKRTILLGNNFQVSSSRSEQKDNKEFFSSSINQSNNKIFINNLSKNNPMIGSITVNRETISSNDNFPEDVIKSYDRFYQKYNNISIGHNDDSNIENARNENSKSSRIATHNVGINIVGDKNINTNSEKYFEISNEISKPEFVAKKDIHDLNRMHIMKEIYANEMDATVANSNIENNKISTLLTDPVEQAAQHDIRELENNTLDINDVHQTGKSNSANELLINPNNTKYVDYLIHKNYVLDLSKFIGDEPVSEEGIDLSARNIFGKFAENISTSVTGLAQSGAQGTYKFTTFLHPEHLGSLEVNIEYSEEHGIKINLVSENINTAEIIKENAAALKNSINIPSSIELNISSNEGNYGEESQKQRTDQTESDQLTDKEQDLRLVEEADEANYRIDPTSPYKIDKLV
jgi:hypothetical protein